ncbi:hypothetical protein BDZ94DRAFT_1056514 [Collybia nuda]|uniref:Uncharacterized protein n=1 Tax=Collybia nuda TaxID=64659 RepID=A0A9P5XYT0_9AGAR|nr:hypothetical protein BDZ94DRAFT_1056514 [Collybia nuda]
MNQETQKLLKALEGTLNKYYAPFELSALGTNVQSVIECRHLCLSLAYLQSPDKAKEVKTLLQTGVNIGLMLSGVWNGFLVSELWFDASPM